MKRRKDTGKWEVRWRENGRNRSKSFTREADALRFEADVDSARENGRPLVRDAGREPLSEFVETWWRLYVVPELAENTRKNYGVVWETHLRRPLGGYRLQDVGPRVVASFKADLIAGGAGPSVVHKALSVLSCIYSCAVRWDYVDRNPVDGVKVPTSKRAREVQLVTPASAEAIRAGLLAQGRLLDATLVSALFYAGLRPQEARALRWGDIGAQTIHVQRAAAGSKIKSTKTGKARTVDLLPALAADLAGWRQAQGSPPDDAFVFPNSRGGVWTDDDWRNWSKRAYAPAAKTVGVTGPPYDLRHSFASLRIKAGWNASEVAAQIGNATEVTLNTYAHDFREFERGVRVNIAELITTARAEWGVREMYADDGDEVAARSPEAASILEADARIRTADPFITSEVLYQLSYVGNTDVVQGTVARSCVNHFGVVRAGIVPTRQRIGACLRA